MCVKEKVAKSAYILTTIISSIVSIFAYKMSSEIEDADSELKHLKTDHDDQIGAAVTKHKTFMNRIKAEWAIVKENI